MYGGVEGFLGTDGDIGERAIGGAVGVPVGGVIGAAGGKALEYALPRLARFGKSRTETAGEAAEGYADETAQGAAQDVINDIPPPPEGYKLDRRSIAMAAEAQETLTAPARQRDIIDVRNTPRRMDAPITEAQLRAASDNINPGDVLAIPSNVVADVDEAAAIQAGRFDQAKPVDERRQLARQTVTNWKGDPVRKVGPVDLVGFLRLRGGLADQGGELRHYVANAPRG
ncbi:hypothetical protein [Croceicoccus pelagius]|uniref:Uncharacterized protein n=1 Tax=Croceicoccus pelagius TaxID=1703341 RepID=A0A916YNV3_9SPHN|nr:hypothetical protein [Croceicoccus pelagius]GGD54320.1 hypothetical protein GCM10010989_30600 [Croceicoccus pelagius]